MTLASAPFGACSSAAANGNEPRQWTAFARATEWINSPPLSVANLRGKIVLVDFWTYTCINWLRTLSYVRAWAAKYREGLVVIGVHTPEFPFEHNLENVRCAVREMRVDYAVAVDNESAIWRAFDNHYWPALYIIDSRGQVRHKHFGEGEYEASERAVQKLLAETGVAVSDPTPVRVDPAGLEAQADWSSLKSPENYLGYQRTENFASGNPELNRRRVYRAPPRLKLNEWGLDGAWTVTDQAIASGAPNARIVNQFHSRDLHLVMGPSLRGIQVPYRVAIDGRPPGAARGLDIDEEGNGMLTDPRLYQLIRQPQPIGDRRFEIEFLDAGAEAYSFTFG